MLSGPVILGDKLTRCRCVLLFTGYLFSLILILVLFEQAPDLTVFIPEQDHLGLKQPVNQSTLLDSHNRFYTEPFDLTSGPVPKLKGFLLTQLQPLNLALQVEGFFSPHPSYLDAIMEKDAFVQLNVTGFTLDRSTVFTKSIRVNWMGLSVKNVTSLPLAYFSSVRFSSLYIQVNFTNFGNLSRYFSAFSLKSQCYNPRYSIFLIGLRYAFFVVALLAFGLYMRNYYKLKEQFRTEDQNWAYREAIILLIFNDPLLAVYLLYPSLICSILMPISPSLYLTLQLYWWHSILKSHKTPPAAFKLFTVVFFVLFLLTCYGTFLSIIIGNADSFQGHMQEKHPKLIRGLEGSLIFLCTVLLFDYIVSIYQSCVRCEELPQRRQLFLSLAVIQMPLTVIAASALGYDYLRYSSLAAFVQVASNAYPLCQMVVYSVWQYPQAREQIKNQDGFDSYQCVQQSHEAQNLEQ